MQHDMICLSGRVFEASQDVIEFDGRVIAQDSGAVGPGTEKLQNIDHASEFHAGKADHRTRLVRL